MNYRGKHKKFQIGGPKIDPKVVEQMNKYMSGNNGDIQSRFALDTRVAIANDPVKIEERKKENTKKNYQNLRRVPNLKLYGDKELQMLAGKPKDQWPEHVSNSLDNLESDEQRVMMHPDFDRNRPVSEQMELNRDNSLRTRVLRGRNTFMNSSGIPIVSDIAKMVAAPGSSFANLTMDAENQYVKPGLGQGLFNLGMDALNVFPNETAGLVNKSVNKVKGIINNGKILKQHWLKGYKEIPKPKSNFKSEIITPQGFQNRVFDSNIQLGEFSGKGHLSEKGFNYRTLSEKELEAIKSTKGVFPKQGKAKGGNENVKYWTKGNEKNWYADNPNQQVIRVRENKFTNDKVVNAADVEFFNHQTGKFEPISNFKPNNFKSEIDWAKWNKEIPDNPSLLNEYNTIEQTSKTNGSWMKNADGSEFQGTPEQFIQQNSENFKKAFPDGAVQTYRGSGVHNPELINNKDFKSVFTGDENLARAYGNAYSNKNYQNYFNPNIPTGEELLLKNHPFKDLQAAKLDPKNRSLIRAYSQSEDAGVYNLYSKNTGKNLKIDAKGADWKKLPQQDNLPYLASNDDVAKYIDDNNLDQAFIKNVHDGISGDVLIAAHKKGNYLKSAIGNNGMFDMTNPNIYKALVPATVGAGILSQQEKPKKGFKEGGETMNYRGKKCIECGGKPKMQTAGFPPKSEDYMDDYEGYQSAMDNWVQSTYDPEAQGLKGLKDFLGRRQKGLPTNMFKTTGNEGTDSNPMDRGPVETGPVETSPDQKETSKIDPYWSFRGLRSGTSWLSGMVERGRQNRYDWMQQTALGQMNPMPTDDFQPNPYNLYMQKGGNLKTIIKDYNKYTNDAQMDMGDGKLDDKGRMQKGGRAPIYTDNPNDPRLRAYNDSLNLYNSGQRMEADYQSLKSRRPEIAKKEHRYKYGQNPALDKEFTGKIKPIEILHNDYLHPGRKNDGETDYQWISGNFKKPVQPVVYQKPQQAPIKKGQPTYEDSLILSKTKTYLPVKGADAFYQKEIEDIIKNGRVYGSNLFDDPKTRAAAKRLSGTGNEYDIKPIWRKVGDRYEQTFKKPVGTPQPQEPKFEKPIPIPRKTDLVDFSNGRMPTPSAPDLQQAVYDNTKPTNYSYTYPTGKYNEQKVIYFPDENLLRNFADKQATTSIQSTGNQATATGTLRMQEGGQLQKWETKNKKGDIYTNIDLLPLKGKDALSEDKKWLQDWIGGRETQAQDLAKWASKRERAKHWGATNWIADKTGSLMWESDVYKNPVKSANKMIDLAQKNVSTINVADNDKVNPESYIPAASGVYSPSTHRVYFPGNPDKETIAHELTHGSKLANWRASSDYIDFIRSNDQKYKSYSDSDKQYLGSNTEIYSRVMGLRRGLDLKPDEYLDKNILKEKIKNNHFLDTQQLFDYLDEDSIIKLLNNLVKTDNKNNPTAKKGGYEIDKMMIMGNILSKLLQMGRLGTSKYRRMKEGGLTANKAREILHDGTVHGKKLTDKQRRYFGAMSKGHTNFRGK